MGSSRFFKINVDSRSASKRLVQQTVNSRSMFLFFRGGGAFGFGVVVGVVYVAVVVDDDLVCCCWWL